MIMVLKFKLKMKNSRVNKLAVGKMVLGIMNLCVGTRNHWKDRLNDYGATVSISLGYLIFADYLKNCELIILSASRGRS
jgi:hypothetical protein